ncbi:MAG: class I SAM-dependent methyltransferase [Deltaproteobacteria bacterium]|nr:class I SAM-dependent methyltransferase [Deltaproteobacteria bacterium]
MTKLPCPVCGFNTFFATDRIVDIAPTLVSWEETLKIVFDASVWTYYDRPEFRRITLYRCWNCQFAQFRPVAVGIEAFYRAISAMDNHIETKWEIQQALIDINNIGARRVLDVGCGSGFFLDTLRRSNPAIKGAGYDANSSIIELIAEKGYSVLLKPGETDAIYYQSFDAICLFQIIEHIEDPLSFIDQFLQYLKPGGLFIISAPDCDGPIKHFSNALTEIPPHHVSQWQETSFQAALQRTGLSRITVKREPLPIYLWDSYLPVIWDQDIWPAKLFRPAARRLKMNTSQEINWVISKLKSKGITQLHGVTGHTVYATAVKPLAEP